MAVRCLPAVLPLVPILVGLSVGAGGGAAAAAGAQSALRPLSATAPNGLGSADTGVPGGTGTLAAFVTRPVALRVAPGGGRALGRIGSRTSFGGPQVLWVRTVRAGWLAVVSPAAGNGHLGWIPQADASLSRVDYEIRVSLAARRLTVLHVGHVVARYTVAVGRPDAPTPTGAFAVTDLLRTTDASGPYGCCILALSARAPHAIQGWGGGDRIAIHSTPETDTIGQPVSHGCVRLTLPEGRWLLDHIPLATPVLISSA